MTRPHAPLALLLATSALVCATTADTITVCAEGCDHVSINAANDDDLIQLAADHPRDDLHVVASVFAEPTASCDDIVVEHAKRRVSHPDRVSKTPERERVATPESGNYIS